MGTPNATRRGNAQGLLRRIVGPPPEKPPGRVSSAIFLVLFVVGFFLAVLSWRGGPSLSDLAITCAMLGSLLFGPGCATAYYRWRGELTGLLRHNSGCVGQGAPRS